jgi:outer membrane protein assembly factor BamE (lipoprotein component of BamABCDE complex)
MRSVFGADGLVSRALSVRVTGIGMPKVGLAAVLAVSLALGGCLGYEGLHYRGYVLDEKAAEQVRTGASAEQVLVVMGTPSTTSTVGGDAWYYISQKVERPLAFMQPSVTEQRVFAVYFDKGKKVQRIANYGLQDGQVFDFVTRTTPTAGAESSFVRNMFSNLLRFS